MKNVQSASSCKVVSIASVSTGAPPQSSPALALVRGQRVINLAELAESIRADRKLSYLVTEAAIGESGWPGLSVEQAIVLLGGEALCSLLSLPCGHRRFATRRQSPLHHSRISPTAHLSPLQHFQEEPE